MTRVQFFLTNTNNYYFLANSPVAMFVTTGKLIFSKSRFCAQSIILIRVGSFDS